MTFAACLAIVMAVITEPIDQRMAPRAIALEIARVARTPLEAAVLAKTAWEEGRLIPNRVGDHGKSLCTMQLKQNHLRLRDWLALNDDLRRCIEEGYARIMQSWQACPDAPLALYASGRCDRGTKLSRRRMTQAASALALVSPDSSPLP
jgi:hypothetical protein